MCLLLNVGFSSLSVKGAAAGNTEQTSDSNFTNLIVFARFADENEFVTDGPLTDFDGKVSEVNTEAGKLKVTLMIFGRETPVELDFNQVAVIA